MAPNSECGEQTWADRTTYVGGVGHGGGKGRSTLRRRGSGTSGGSGDRHILQFSVPRTVSILVQLSPQRQTRVTERRGV